MEIFLRNGIFYSISFIKLLLVLEYLFELKPRKYISIAFAGSVLAVMVTANWIDLSEYKYSLLFGIPELLVFVFFMSGYRKELYLLLGFLTVNILDIFVGMLFFGAFPIHIELSNTYPIIRVFESGIVLVLIKIYIFIRSRTRKTFQLSSSVIPIYIIGGIGVTAYLTAFELAILNNRDMFMEQITIVISQGTIIVSAIIICILYNNNQLENKQLKTELEMSQKLLKIENDYFINISKKNESTRKFRHDIKAHYLSLKKLYSDGNYEELNHYLEEIDRTINKFSSGIQTGNPIIDAIWSEFESQYPSISFTWNGHIDLSISPFDISTIFYNLLKNACEASIKTSNPWIEINARMYNKNVIVEQSNPYVEIKKVDGLYLTTKPNHRYGYGIQNIRACVEKNNGSYLISSENGIFHTEITFIE